VKTPKYVLYNLLTVLLELILNVTSAFVVVANVGTAVNWF